MGMTLPLLTKIFSRVINNFFGAVSLLYFINTIGAAVGAIVASYVIISFFGLLYAVYVAAAINLSIAVLILLVLKLVGFRPAPQITTNIASTDAVGLGLLAYPIATVTGFWQSDTRSYGLKSLGSLLKNSPYAFSSVLSVYLIGIAVGSVTIRGFLRRYQNMDRKSLFFVLQFLIGLTVGLSFIGYYYLTRYTAFAALTRTSFLVEVHPGWDALEGAKLFLLFDVFVWSAIFVLIPHC